MTGDIIDQLGTRHEADGADSLYVDVSGQPSKQTNHYKDQDPEAPKTDVIRFISTPSPCPVRNQAAPAQTQGQHRSEAGDPQTPCHLQSEADDHRIDGHHHRNTSADQLRTDVIGSDECLTFSDFQEKREAFEFFSSLDIILVQDTCDFKNWFGVSKWILTPYNMEHLVEYLNGLKVTIQDPPGNSYFNHVIRNEFVNKGVKLGQVLHFYAEKYSNYKIKKLFQKYHPECGYCQKFYDVKEK
ncbi:uncharacterized protein LOC117328848 [Pecten maximus]|uniref:uncharacterized protein LOC117328848 n=1 Tax=Pecten maximus TaxID=6579 RepID=UPI00145862DD|nr:uncharacterized protein LOC117328848 [Pecten maximus]